MHECPSQTSASLRMADVNTCVRKVESVPV